MRRKYGIMAPRSGFTIVKPFEKNFFKKSFYFSVDKIPYWEYNCIIKGKEVKKNDRITESLSNGL